jgi:hypothetical protein
MLVHRRQTAREALRITGEGVRALCRAPVGPSTSSARRGVALLVVLVATAVVLILATEFSYNSRTNLWMSGNIRAATQAYYNARSATQIAVLAVNAKRTFPEMSAALNMLGKGASEKLEVWRQACTFVEAFCDGKAKFFGTTILDFKDDPAVGVKSGKCSCTVEAEDGRINLNAASTDIAAQVAEAVAGGLEGGTRPPQPPPGGPGQTRTSRSLQARNALGLRLLGILRPMLEQDFDREEDMVQLVTNIMDWTDADESETIATEVGFEDGTGPEPDYDGFEAKDAKMDTVAEVQLVEGMTSEVFCRIRDELTVFSTDKINVNDGELGVLKGVLCEALPDPITQLQMCWNYLPGQLPLMDQALLALDQCRQLKKLAYSTPFGNVQHFLDFFRKYPGLVGAGVAIPINDALARQQLDVVTKMVRVTAEGTFCWDKECKRSTTRTMTSIIDVASGSLLYFSAD